MGEPAKRKDFPLIELDTTMYDLLCAESDGPLQEIVSHFKPNADRRYKEIPFNDKFLITSSNVPDGETLAHLQLENVSNLLMFPVGGGRIAYVASEGIAKDPSLTRDSVHKTAVRNFSVLKESQRPDIITYANADDYIRNHPGKDPIRWGFAVDFAEKIDSIFSPELVYKLNSKRWLAENSLKSANDRIIDCMCKCPNHQTKDGVWFYGGESCAGCKQAIKDEIERVREKLEGTPAPFVLKLTQCLGSVGTHIAEEEKDKKDIIKFITEENLPAYLPRISDKNAHIYPTALVLSDFVKGDTAALNFFIKKDGKPVFVGACNQLTTRTKGGRQSTAITFADQEKLKDKYIGVLEDIGRVLRDEGGGYYGPIGADIMEDPDTGEMFTIDLNVRVPTSWTLYLIKGHCEKRGLKIATIYECIILSIDRDTFEEKFADELHEGRIIILGSTKLGKHDSWAYPLIVAGESREAIEKLTKRITEFESKGGKEAQEAGSG